MSARSRGRGGAGLPPATTAPGPEVTAERVELLGLGVMLTVLEWMSPDERRRTLAHLADRFGRAVVPAHVHVVSDLEVLVSMLASYRRAAGISQQTLATQLGTTQSAVSEWETGQALPSGTSLFALANVLDCDLAIVPRGAAVQLAEPAAGDPGE